MKQSGAITPQVFAEAEASLRLEGLQPTPLYYAVKARVLDGAITIGEGKASIIEHHRRRVFVDSTRRMVESERLKVPASVLAQAERYVSGEIDRDEFLASL